MQPDNLITLSKSVTLKPYQPRALIPYELMSDEEIIKYKGDTLFIDSETYHNYFLVAFRHQSTQKVITFELTPTTTFNTQKLAWILQNYKTVGFNTLKYDFPVIYTAIHYPDLPTIKRASDEIIINNGRPKDIEDAHNFKIPKLNHIDLIEVAPLKGSLKLYGARLHSKRIQDLPFDPHQPLEDWQIPVVSDYCINGDLPATELIYNNLTEQLQLRTDLSRQYQQDLMSKSDAQIAEAVIGSELKKISGRWPQRPKTVPGQVHRYQVPSYVFFQTPRLQAVLDRISKAEYVVQENGRLVVPKDIEGLSIEIGKGLYRIGNGGLHSSETNVAIKNDDEYSIRDFDVNSYYPTIILNSRLYPKHLGEDFLTVYKTLVESRLADKLAKRIAQSESKKITINGTFGKLGSPWSILYSPELMVQVTLTGQLCLLMLIEQMELCGIEVVSANTDGIVMRIHNSKKNELYKIINLWEQITGFTTEETEYEAVYSRDVNGYIAIKKAKNGQVETKGKNIYYDPWQRRSGRDGYWIFQKNPQGQICVEALEKLIVDGVPTERTIRECKDITRFVFVRNVTGGAHKDGVFLGKTIRWYLATNTVGTINYITSGNKVPDTDGAKPLMDIDEFPDDIDYKKYIDITEELLYDCGYKVREKQERLF